MIVKPLISESPLLDFKGVKTPRLEKILVDIYCDDDLDYLHGNEWSRIATAKLEDNIVVDHFPEIPGERDLRNLKQSVEIRQQFGEVSSHRKTSPTRKRKAMQSENAVLVTK